MTDILTPPAAVEMLDCGYRTKCKLDPCGNLARTIFRFIDDRGRPLNQIELCFEHTKRRIETFSLCGPPIHDKRGARA